MLCYNIEENLLLFSVLVNGLILRYHMIHKSKSLHRHTRGGGRGFPESRQGIPAGIPAGIPNAHGFIAFSCMDTGIPEYPGYRILLRKIGKIGKKYL